MVSFCLGGALCKAPIVVGFSEVYFEFVPGFLLWNIPVVKMSEYALVTTCAAVYALFPASA
jgi:hypothetical protein